MGCKIRGSISGMTTIVSLLRNGPDGLWDPFSFLFNEHQGYEVFFFDVWGGVNQPEREVDDCSPSGANVKNEGSKTILLVIVKDFTQQIRSPLLTFTYLLTYLLHGAESFLRS